MTLPPNWRQITLKVSGIPVSDFALEVMTAWRKSTPLPDVTYNPLGMPARLANAPRYLETQYALFPGVTTFASRFARFMASNKAIQLRHALTLAESLSAVWREIHALNWPGNLTETDYPAVLLDMVEAKYRSKLQTREHADRTTAGMIGATPDVHAAVRQQAQVLHHAAANIKDARRAISYIVKGLG